MSKVKTNVEKYTHYFDRKMDMDDVGTRLNVFDGEDNYLNVLSDEINEIKKYLHWLCYQFKTTPTDSVAGCKDILSMEYINEKLRRTNEYNLGFCFMRSWSINIAIKHKRLKTLIFAYGDLKERLGMISSNLRNVEEKSVSMSEFAKMRHSETYALKAQAIEHWHKHIDPKLSNPKAADLLAKIVPVGHRKLVEYVAKAKLENIHPAS